MTAALERWLTLHATANTSSLASDLYPQLTDALDAIGAILAADRDVGGSEMRTDSLGAPELVVYARVEARERLEQQLRTVADSLLIPLGAAPDIRGETHEGSDWREVWKQFYRPMVFGAGALLVRPSWIPRRRGDPEREVILDPGQAFGTGQHETTRLCLNLLARLARDGDQPKTVLDLGTGSGILALGAARLFPAARVRAIDLDPVATEAARDNVRVNGLQDRVEVLTGDINAAGIDPYPLAIANIRPEVLLPVAPQLARITSPGANLLLSGILDEEHDAVAAAYAAPAWRLLDRPLDGEWRALLLQREGVG
ncbi:MAG: methyltransferase [Myxococcales bacterium FL481]|nr:MAG: methyltransferase [Myxococcales bacterium FL481]